ncbi:MAG: hypothetical protein A4E62_03035 [Syntrophorhabdus sp. PtaU1.Bin002]|nr:MAG: hypothetical protein A4E62_03035 [Syntrophorhabdus sp. PtaU1.Bin002]
MHFVGRFHRIRTLVPVTIRYKKYIGLPAGHFCTRLARSVIVRVFVSTRFVNIVAIVLVIG